MIGPLKPFNTIGDAERRAVLDVLDEPYPILSGYLGGKERGGKWVCALEDAWCETFGVRHAVACNSATSALLAASFACGLRRGDLFVCSPYTMSATAAAPMITGAEPFFYDVEEETFCVSGIDMRAKAAFVTHLFGHPAETTRLRFWETCLIEDNSQSPFAADHKRYTGTIGHIGCWSLNVHKHLQAGEGGICTTDDDGFARQMRHFINHAEMFGRPFVGLNLRMTELTAALALAQLRRGKQIVQGRIEQAERLIEAIGSIPGLRPPVVREGCTHVYYTIPYLIGRNRSQFVKALAEHGVPLVEGYVAPLYRSPAFSQYARPCPVAEDLHDRSLFYFENCAYDLAKEQIKLIGDAFCEVAEQIERNDR